MRDVADAAQAQQPAQQNACYVTWQLDTLSLVLPLSLLLPSVSTAAVAKVRALCDAARAAPVASVVLQAAVLCSAPQFGCDAAE